MSAVFTGNGLGLFEGRWAPGGLGEARVGQGADRQWVNVATGNLLLQAQDEQLLFRGLSVGQLRTYNSLGLVGQVGQDAWLTGFERRVELLSGALNEAGSVIRRHLGDGSTQDFQYLAPNSYRSTAGDGAHDSLSWDAAGRAWSYVEGSSRREEGYADHADGTLQGRLTRIRDLKTDGGEPVTWAVQYGVEGRISEVRAVDGAGNGDALLFSYGTEGRLSGVATREAGVVRGQVAYEYDGVGRLVSVITDLTPADGAGDRDTWDSAVAANNDGYLFRTDYTYADGTSLRITQVRQSDGTLVSYEYDAQGRIATLTRGDSNSDDTDGVGQTLSFSYDVASRRTDVSDSSGRTWSYAYDADGRLTRVESPAIDGLRDVTTYAYDAGGDVSRVSITRGGTVLSQTDFQHDANGNLLWQWEVVDPSQGGTARAVQRTYTSANQVASETIFTGLDPDGAGTSHAPQGGLTTRYVYDSSDRLRFVVGATGDVRELTYASSGNAIGQVTQSRQYLGAGYSGTTTLSALEAWATSAQRANSTLVENAYNLYGRLSQTVAFAKVDGAGVGVSDDSASITEYVYDAQGLLRQQIERRSSTAAANDGRDTTQASTFTYDGLGRLISQVVTQQVGTGAATVLRTSVWRHVDSAMTLIATVEGGKAGDGASNDLLRTQVRNAAGQIVVSTESAVTGGTTHTSRNYYDASGRLRASEDVGGARTYYFHDAEGALVGQVDATGAVTVYTHNGLGQVVSTTTYATRVDTSAWLAGGQVVPTDIQAVKPTAHADDRTGTATYDAQGRVLTSTDGEGGITTYSYDGAGRLIQERGTDAAGTAASARLTRYFHDASGREIARLDAEGYLVEYSYDRAGRLVRTVAYASATNESLRSSGTLAELRPASHASDQRTRIFHDGRGNRIAELNAEGYLTEYVIDEARNQRAVRSYGRQLTGLNGNEGLAELRTLANGGQVRETRRSFDALGNVLVEVNAEGTVTRYSYDAQGRLLKQETAQGTSEVREGHLRYDVFGNLIGELAGEGATHLLAGMSEAQLDAVYAQHGVRHVYDARGQRIESIDAQGHKTWYFYDAVGRSTFTVRGVASAQGVANAEGEVTETRYTTFGDVRETIAYTGRITIGVPGNRASVGNAVAVLQYAAATDSRTTLAYDRRGLLTARTDAEQYRTEWRYSAFGDLLEQTDVTSGVSTGYVYDRRGLRTSQVDDQGGLDRSRSWIYDAFGRVTSATDGRGHAVTFTYDRLGRQVAAAQTVAGRAEQQSTAYDAFDRVLSQTDASGRTTTYQYDDATRGVTLTTAEGVSLVTQRNRHGETWKVVDALGHATEYRYDKDGQLVETLAADGGTSTRGYSARGLMTSTVDATGRRVDYQYDAAGRLFKRIEDPAGLALTTVYAYDGQGRQVTVTDPSGVRTSFAYDRKGQLSQTVRDSAGLALKTAYTWDAQGRQLTVTEGAGTAAATKVAYAYDALGRRTSETVDPGTGKLNLTTTYTYDANDNLVSRTDAEGRVTRFSHDEANREVFRIDGAGGVVRTWYDTSGRVVATRRYAQAISLQGLGLAVTGSAIQARLTTQDAKDVQSYRVHDGDGRLKYSIDGAGAVTEAGYDAAGRQVTSRHYASAVSLSGLRASLQAGTATPASVAAGLTADAANDHVSYAILDAVGRTRFTVQADGAVFEQRHDLAGRVTQTWAYATAVTLSAAERAALKAGTLQGAAMATKVAPQASAARAQYVVHDSVGRERYRVERSSADKGVVSELVYDAAGRVVADRRFGTEVGFDPSQTPSTLAALLPASGDTAVMRHTRYVYDAAGRMRFEIDASGAVSESRYDASGRVTQSREFSGFPPAGAATEAALASWSQAQSAASVRSTVFTYDGAGRLETRKDALQQIERYEYDGTGLVLSYTDRNTHVWNYEYDAAGRKVREISPQVTVASVDANGSVTNASRRLTTLIGYDALGNVVSRTEDEGTAGARTTLYAYDNRGNQVRTTFPDAWKINEATGDLEASGHTPTIEVTYDLLGRAVVQKDVRGHYSYKVYDRLDRVAYEVDQEGHVTAHGYNALGEQVTLRRYASRIDTSALSGWSQGRALTTSDLQGSGVLTTSASDRTLSTSYDARGNKVQVIQSQVSYYNAGGSKLTGTPTTRFAYSAFGEVVKESVLLEGVAGQSSARWADTYRYYDALSRNVFTVDAEGYATTTRYAATGEVVETIEHARALEPSALGVETLPSAPPPGDAVSGYDRAMRWDYDALGRKISEVAVRRYQRDDGSAGVRDVEAVFDYDGEGRLTRLTTDAGTTITRYDALGRTLSVKEPVRAVLTASAESSLKASTVNDLSTSGLYQEVSPYTAMAYDAFGNVVQVRRYANGLKAGQSTPVADAARDQIQVTRYDRQGRAVMSRDAEGNRAYSAYDAADNLVHTWYRLGGSVAGRDAIVHGRYEYDKAGRQTGTVQSRVAVSGGAETTDLSEAVQHNAFGEIIRKTQAGMSGALDYAYDAAGRLTSTNEGGATRAIGYNLAGHQVRESHKAYLNASSTVDAVSWNVTDRLGRVVVARMPAHNAANDPVAVTQQLDRWGNVIEIIDGRGYQTRYQYNQYNQIVRDERPLVKVVSETGEESWTHPVNEWFYDALGRLVATRDANGHTRTNEYDSTGQLIESVDALGNATRYAFDALGNQRMTQDPMGYLTFREYDRLNRVVAIGDYLPGASGTTRGKTLLQQYTLNRNGDRLKVEDALGYTALYDFDSRSLLLRSQTTMGVTLDFDHDVAGNKVRQGNALSGPSTIVDRDGETVRLNELTWDYDVHGRVVDHNNLSGRDYDYSYDAPSGQLTTESSAGGSGMPAAVSKTTSYYANGRIREIVESNGNRFRYEYDAAGNRTLEEVVFTDGNGAKTHTVTRTLYDSHNRVERVTQDTLTAGTAKRVFDLAYEYDAVGNRRRVVARSGYGPNVGAVPVDNSAPVAISTPADRVVRKGVTSEFRILFSDVFRDAAQDPLTLLVAQSNGSALPAWLSVQHDSATGEIVFVANPPANAADQNITVRLTARETANVGNTAFVDFQVRVRTNTAPTLVTAGTASLRAKTGQAWAIELLAADYFRDLDVGDELTLSIPNAAALPAWLQLDDGHPSVLRLTGTPPASSTFSFKVRATDQKGAYVEKTFQVTTAPNAAPQKVVSALVAQEAILGRDFEWTRNLAQIFTDVDGDRLQVTASGLPAWMAFQYLEDQATPQMRLAGYPPATVADGTQYTVTFKATDPDGLSATITLSVTVRQNRAPAATNWTAPALRVNDAYDVTLPISTLFNDPEGDQVFIEPIWPTGSTLPQWLNIVVDQEAKTVRLHGKPTSNAQAGNLTFQLRGSDADGLSASANVSISVGTDNPPERNTGVTLGDRALDIGRTFSFRLPANLFTDADSDAVRLTASVVTEHEEYVDTVPPTWMRWVESGPLPSWLDFDPDTRTFSGNVPGGMSPESLVIRVRGVDTRGRVSSANQQYVGEPGIGTDSDFTLSLRPFVNSAPVFNGGLPNRTVKHGVAVDFPLPSGVFTEPNGDGLTYAAWVQEPGHWEMRDVSDNPYEPELEQVWVEGDWVSLSSIGLNIDSATGRISGTASNLTQASINARIVAYDPQGLMAVGTFEFAVTNTPPTANAIPVQTVGRNLAASGINLSPYFQDVNANHLTFAVVSGLPSGLTLSSNGQITGTTAAALGTYQVTIRATDGRGGSVDATFTLKVANTAPVVPAIPNQTAPAGTAWSYTIPAASDANGDTLTYSIAAGTLPGWMTFNAATRKLSGTPGAVGSWTITVTVSDGTTSVNKAFTVTTPNAAPVVDTPIATKSAGRNVNWSYTVPAGTFSDANGDTLTYSASGMPSGITFDPATRKFSGKATALGSYTVTLSANDGQGGVRATTFVLKIVNIPPTYTAGSLPNRNHNLGQSTSWTLPSGAFVDPNGDALSYSLYVLIPEHYEHYMLAPGEPDLRLVPEEWVLASRVGLSIAANGTITGAPSALVYSRTADGYPNPMPLATHYSYSLKVVAKDTSDAIAEGSFGLTLNRPPTANGGNVTVGISQAFNTAVPGFSDPEGGSLTYTATLVGGGALPSWLSFSSAGVLTGTASAAGTWELAVTARDSAGLTSTATVTLRAVNNPPTYNSGTIPATLNASATVNFGYQIPAGAFTDPNGDSLTYTAYMSVWNEGFYDGEGMWNPGYWQNQPLPSWLSFNATTRTLSGTATAQGTYTIAFVAKDQNNASVQMRTTLDVGPAPNYVPVAPALTNKTVSRNKAWSFQVPPFTDANGDSLSYSSGSLPPGVSFNAATRTFSGTPSTVGSFTMTITANDGRGGVTSASFKLNVVNNVPVAPTIANRTVPRNTTFSYQIPAFTDGNNDALTYSVNGLPAGVTFAASTRTFSGKPTVIGNYPITVSVSDGHGGTASASFTLSVANSAPVAPTIPNQTAAAGSSWAYTIPAFTDANSDSLTYTVTGMPSWMSFAVSTRKLSGTAMPAGSWTITVKASDGITTVSKSFTVTTPNVAPVVANGISNKSASRNKAWSFTVPTNTFTDANGDGLTYSASGMPAGITFDAATRKFSGTPTTLGSKTVTVTVQDGRGGSRSTSFTINVVNNAPTYSAGSLPSRSAQQGQSVSWALPSGAFGDANGDALSYSLMVEFPSHREWYWDAGEAAWMVRDVPARWQPVYTLSINSVGTITGTLPVFNAPVHPVTGAGGYLLDTYRVKVIASDGHASAEGIFTASVNIAPTASSLPNRTIKSAVAWTYDFPAFSDANGDSLTYSVTGLPAGLSHTSGTGRRISGTPTASGTFTVRVTANDGKGGTVSRTFTLTVQANGAPTAPSIPNKSATVGVAFSYAVPAFTDPNGDSLTYTAAGLPAGLSFNAGSRTISGTPTAAGSKTVTITARDGRGGAVSKSFTISVVTAPPPNRAPVINKQAASPAYSYFGTNRHLVPVQTLTLPADTFTDADNNPLTYTVLQKPSWLSYSFGSGGHKFSGVPNHTNTRYMTSTIRLQAKDPSGALVVMTFTVASEYDYNDPGNPTDPMSLPGEPMLLMTFDMGESLAPAESEGASLESGGMVGDASIGTSSVSPYQVTEQWFTYDAENRIRINNGKLDNGQILVKSMGEANSAESFELMYDAAGREVSRFRYNAHGAGYVYRTAYDLRGQKVMEFHAQAIGGTGQGVSKAYTYDVAGRLVQTRSYFSSDATRQVQDQEGINWNLRIGGWLSGAEQFTHDGDHRLVSQVTKGREEGNWWDAFGNSLGENQSSQRTDLSVLQDKSGVYYTKADGSSGYDSLGRVQTYRYRGQEIHWATHTYTSTYQGWESYQERTVTGTSSNTNYKTTTNTLSYDSMGRLLSQREKTNYDNVDDRIRYYAYNGDGQVQMRREGRIEDGVFKQGDPDYPNNPKPNYLFVHAGGQQQAELKEGGSIRTRNGSYSPSQLQGLGGSGRYDAGGGKVTVMAGETLRSLAQRIYGTPQLWYVLADANGLGEPDAPLAAGTQLNTPSTRVSGNDSSTFKPYNPNEAIGNTSPSLPYITPPPKESCSTLAIVLMVVVAVVVTIVTYGAASAAISSAMGAAAGTVTTTGAVLGGAVAGAAGSAASGVVGSVTGVGSFSWRDVAAGAVTGAITGGVANQWGSVSTALDGSDWLKAAGLAVANAGAGYVGQKIAGTGVSFNWNSIAASAVSSMVAGKVAPRLTSELGLETEFANDFAHGMAGGMVSAAVRSSFGQTLHQTDYMTVIADAFGNALGNAAERQRIDRVAQRSQVKSGMSSLLDAGYKPDWLYGDDTAPLAMGGVRESISSVSSGLISVPGRDVRGSSTAIGGDSAASEKAGGYRYPTYPEDVLAAEPDKAAEEHANSWRYYNGQSAVREAGFGPPPTDASDISALYHWNSAVGTWAAGELETHTLETVAVRASEQVDEMGQPLYGRSNYDAFAKFGEIWSSSADIGGKLGQTWRWASYTVPDKEQIRIEREAKDTQFWRIDHMRQSPLGSMAYVAGHLSGASQQTQDALLMTGSLADAMMPGSARAPLRPASMRTRPGPPSAEPNLVVRPGAQFGTSTSSAYRAAFFEANPSLKGKVVVHHAVEQSVLNRFPGVVTVSEMHSLENLRGIPNQYNSELHLGLIRREWNRFYKPFEASGTAPTKTQLLQKASEIDTKYGSQFYPPR